MCSQEMGRISFPTPKKCSIDWKALNLYEFITIVTVLLQAQNWP